MTRTIPEFIKAVRDAFYIEQKRTTLDNVFLSLQQSMIGALEANGDNTTKLKHMGKAKLRNVKLLPVLLTAEQKLLRNSRLFLEHHRHVLVTAARIKAAKNKAVEDKKEEIRLDAAVRKDEKIMEAEALRFEAALRKEEKNMETWSGPRLYGFQPFWNISVRPFSVSGRRVEIIELLCQLAKPTSLSKKNIWQSE